MPLIYLKKKYTYLIIASNEQKNFFKKGERKIIFKYNKV